MSDRQLKAALHDIAHRDVPDSADLWPRLQPLVGRREISIARRFRLSWSIALLILALVVLTTVAYALYRYFNDPGMRSVEQAGLIRDVNATAQSDLLTPQPPFAEGPGVATILGQEQTLDGVSTTLDWVYLEDARQVFHVTVKGLAPDMRLGMPAVTYPGVTPEQYSGAIFSLAGGASVDGTYVSNQLLRPNGIAGGTVAMRIDIPLLNGPSGQAGPVAVFHFEASELKLTVPWGGGGGGTYAVRVNGLEMRQEYAIMAPSYVAVRLCYQLPSAGRDWAISHLTAQYGGQSGLLGQAEAAGTYTQVADEGSDRCADVDFPLARTSGAINLIVTANGLAAQDSGGRVDGTWQFYTTLADSLSIPGISQATPTPAAPLASETVGGLTATLESAYLDANRMAFTVHFDGWKAGYGPGYITLRERDGHEVNVGADFRFAEGDPSTAIINLTPDSPYAGSRFVGQLILDLNETPGGGASTLEFSFDLDLPVLPARVVEPMQTVTVNGINMILQSVKIAPSYSVVYLCYQKPTPDDWMLADGATLQVGGDQVAIATYTMLYDSDFATGKGPEPGWKPALAKGRCVKAGFPVGSQGQQETLTLTIPGLQRSMPEAIPDADVQKALRVLKSQGIEMDWTTFSGNGGGGGGPVYRKLPQGMTEAEAYQRFVDALGYSFNGPWIFSFQIKP